MIISLKEARKLLGKDGKDLSDGEVEKLVDDLSALARAFIQSVQRGEIDIPPKIGKQKKLSEKDAQKVGEYFELLDEIDNNNPKPLSNM